MERGLVWLPLLGLFIGLAWAGWHEFQKVEGYRVWAQSFDRAKYDIKAALGQKGDRLTWGRPTRKGLADLQSVRLADVASINLRLNGTLADWDDLPERAKNPTLELVSSSGTMHIPFTDLAMAIEWGTVLRREVSIQV